MSSSSSRALWLVLSSVVSVPGSQLRLRVSISPALCSCSPRVLVCSHACFLERLLSRQRKAQSFTGNPGTQTAESHFLGPRVNPDLGNSVDRLLFHVFALSVSLGNFPKKSNTDIDTGRVQLLFPQRTQYVIIQTVSSVRQVDDRHPLIQTTAVSAESVDFVQRRILPQRRLRILQRGESSCWFKKCAKQTAVNQIVWTHKLQQLHTRVGNGLEI